MAVITSVKAMEIAGKALASGGNRLSLLTAEWDLAPDCLNPKGVSLDGLPFNWFGNRVPGTPFTVLLSVRCRKCLPCREAHRRMWSMRALDETARSSRTWFGTLTLSPSEHYLTSIEFGPSFDDRVKGFGVRFTKYMKRLRKQSGAKLRYMVVCEAHKSGLPHFHVLIHEISKPVRYRILDGQWTYGHSKFNLVADDRQVHYVCKYLTKSVAARVRASQRYGTGDLTGIAAVSQTSVAKCDLRPPPLSPSLAVE